MKKERIRNNSPVIVVFSLFSMTFVMCNDKNNAKEEIEDEYPPPWLDLEADHIVVAANACKMSNYNAVEKKMIDEARKIMKEKNIRIVDLKEEICLVKKRNKEGEKPLFWWVSYGTFFNTGPGGGWEFEFSYPEGELKSFHRSQ